MGIIYLTPPIMSLIFVIIQTPTLKLDKPSVL